MKMSNKRKTVNNMDVLSSLKSNLKEYRYYRWLYKKYQEFRKTIAFKEEAKRMAVLSAQTDSIGQILSANVSSEIFLANQKTTEITSLLSELQKLQPKTVVEIGTHRGGTMFLFSQACSPSAILISIDFQYPSLHYPKAIPAFKRPLQRIICIQADSHQATTLKQVRRLIKNRPIDFLFIDGDHSYDGVKKDYELFSPLVRSGGVIAFHDIVTDYFTRYQQNTGTYTGGVPKFWGELKQIHSNTLEFIEDPEQDGYGIGLIFVP